MSLKPNTLRGRERGMNGINSLGPAMSPSPQHQAVSRMGAKQEPCQLQAIPGDMGTCGGGTRGEGHPRHRLPCPDGGGREDPLYKGCLVGIEAQEVGSSVEADEDTEGIEGSAAGGEVACPPGAQPHEQQVVDAGGGGGQGDPCRAAPRGRSVTHTPHPEIPHIHHIPPPQSQTHRPKPAARWPTPSRPPTAPSAPSPAAWR